ncbi:MAG: glycosyltransferase family 4 protein [Chloroflexota bacterium]|nr:glycosyltransferase family 4 protein [Dehalococcoidia bacterium]MDW8253256.1 glycosyltransferase family 4 protein [Chloroflexota bacterium]
MNIVLLGCFALSPKGTVAQRALPLGRALARRGHRVTLLIPPYDNPQEAGQTWTEEGVRVEALTARFGLLGWTAALIRRALALRPDVIHAFKPVGPSGAAAFLLARRFPLVLDLDDWEGWRGFARVGGYPFPVAAAMEIQERLTPRRAHQLTVASRALRKREIGRGCPPSQLHYLPNCVDAAAVAGDPPSPEAVAAFRAAVGATDCPIVLFVGHVPAHNDLDLALAALAPIAESSVDFRWVVVGDGPGLPPLRAALPPALAERTRFLGRLARPALRVAFAASRLLLVPARDTPINRAKCPMKVVDALAAGLPVVAPAIGQHLEYIVHGETGLLTPVGDLRALAAAARQLLVDPAFASRLGRAAAERMRHGFTWDHWVGQAERAYRAAANGIPF